MQLDVLNDLAKAKRRWTEKKIGAVMRSIPSSTGDISLEMFENESGHRDRVHLKVWIK
jgi:hypothetical protein